MSQTKRIMTSDILYAVMRSKKRDFLELLVKYNSIRQKRIFTEKNILTNIWKLNSHFRAIWTRLSMTAAKIQHRQSKTKRVNRRLTSFLPQVPLKTPTKSIIECSPTSFDSTMQPSKSSECREHIMCQVWPMRSSFIWKTSWLWGGIQREVDSPTEWSLKRR